MKTKPVKILLAAVAAVSLQIASTHASSLTLNFSSAGGTILDTNGIGTGFTARMAGTGSAITGNDPNLLLSTNTPALTMHTSPGADFNGQVDMSTATVVGVNLSSLGYTGSNDFTATAVFTGLPTTGSNANQALQPDQLCLIVGTDSTTAVRAGFINFNQFHAVGTDANEGFGTLTSGGSDAFDRFFGSVVGSTMTVVIKRIGGVWSVTVNGIDRMPNSSADGTGTPEPPTVIGLDAVPDLFVGVVAMDVGNDSPWSANLSSFSVVVSGNSPPSIATQPQKLLVDEGNPATFSVVPGDNTKAPISYQWYDNGVAMNGQTNDAVTFNPSVANAGGLTVIITNSLGSVTSSVAPLYVVMPKGTFSLNFGSPVSGGILDSNGVGTGFQARLPGTGAALPTDDTNLFVDTVNGLLDITTTSSDYNGGNGMDVNENLGVALSSLGFTGTQDLNVTAFFPQPFPATASFDQFGVYVGQDTNYLTRDGSITFANKERFSENVAPVGGVPQNGGGQYFGFAFDSTIPMTAFITRTAGVWHYYIDGVNWDVLTQPDPTLDSTTNLTAGVFAEDVANGVHKTFLLQSFEARVFDKPNVKVNAAGGNLNFTWNVAGAGLQSTTNLSDPNSWTPIANATNSPYVIPITNSGSKFYRIGL
ncbi:MAG TPA: hypothetical protein VKV04_12285 [Verrucomicrobiae bacterium]|nr:hypothetical protein [Verrucomicrobiae bacterium]